MSKKAIPNETEDERKARLAKAREERKAERLKELPNIETKCRSMVKSQPPPQSLAFWRAGARRASRLLSLWADRLRSGIARTRCVLGRVAESWNAGSAGLEAP